MPDCSKACAEIEPKPEAGAIAMSVKERGPVARIRTGSPREGGRSDLPKEIHECRRWQVRGQYRLSTVGGFDAN